MFAFLNVGHLLALLTVGHVCTLDCGTRFVLLTVGHVWTLDYWALHTLTMSSFGP